ncbi:MAG: hypothetical protein DRJ03_03685 [Chloroflexi bacterium]|nr:MAG: hypothetical protein DRJ03_03685 [Chloroflexota bacterium]
MSFLSKIRKIIKRNSGPRERQKGVVSAAYRNVPGVFQGSKKKSKRRAIYVQWFWNAPYGQPRNVNILELREYAQSTWCQLCINTLIDEVTTVDWDIVPKRPEDAENEVVLQHCREVREFFEKPNLNDESFEQILRQVVRDILEIDAGVIVKTFENGKMTEFYSADGATFLKDVDEYGVVRGYYQYSLKVPNAKPIYFTDREIVYIMQNPRSYSCYGFSAVQYLMSILKTLIASMEWNETYFSESAVPSGLLALLGISEEDYRRFVTYWETQIKGKPHKLPIVSTDVKWIPFSMSNKELQFLESQKWYTKLVMAAFKVTPNELGFTETVNRATSEEQSEVFRRKGLGPLLRLLEYHINAEIIPEFGYDDIKFQFAPGKDRFEEERQVNIWVKQLQAGLRTINEIRREMGLEPVPWGNEPFHPALFLQQKQQQQEGPPELQFTIPSTQTKTKALTSSSPLVPKPKQQVKPIVVGYDDFYKLPNPATKQNDPRTINVDQYEDYFLNELKILFNKQAQEIINLLKQEKTAAIIMEKDVKVFRDILEKLFTTHLTQFKDLLVKMIRRGLEIGGKKAFKELKLEIDFDLQDPLAEQYIQTYVDLLASQKYRQVKERIREVLTEGIRQGLSIDKLGDMIQQEYEPLTTWEAERIARTEAIRATNMGRLIGYNQSGMVKAKQWIVTWDDRLCPDCLEMANQTVPLLAKFIHPSFGQVDTPPLHPNCRCTIVPVLKESVIQVGDKYININKTEKILEIEKRFGDNIYNILKTKYIDERKSTRTIAKELNVTHPFVIKWLKKCQIPLRNNLEWKNHKNRR